MKLLALLLLLAPFVSSLAFADSAATVDPLPFDDFKRIAGDRIVTIDAPTKEVILEFANRLAPLPPQVASVANSLRGDAKSISLKALMPLFDPENGQAVSAKMAKHDDPVVRFVSGVVLSGSGISDAAQTVHALIHDESLPSTDKRLIRTWCDGIGIRAASDDAGKILAHLTAAMSNKPKFKKGDVAPKFDAITISGRKISSQRLAGKLIVLHFWATWCGPCMGQMQSHIETLSKHKSDTIEIVFVSLDEDEEAFKSAVEKYRMPFNNVREPRGWGGELARTFGVNAMPFDIVIGRDGKVVSNSIDDVSAVLDTHVHAADDQ